MLVLGRDNLPSTARELTAWQSVYGAPLGSNHRLVMDPQYLFRSAFLALKQLPIVVLVDPRVMRVRDILIAPQQQALDYAIERATAEMDGLPLPRPGPSLGDIELSEDQLDMMRAMAQIPAPPPSPSNRYADDPRAISLGNRLFREQRLSSGPVSCASCHEAINEFTDRRARGVGIDMQMGGRNTPTVRFAPYTRWAFWDGRVDSAWSQALGPIENPIEMRGSRLRAAHVLYDFYRAEYEAIFGPLPALSDLMRYPADGRPGEPAFDGMSDADKLEINRVYANLGKSIEAYERTLRFMPSAFDRYANGDRTALTAQQQAGLHHFFHNGCIQCHHGPMMTDDSFHNIGMPTGRGDGMADQGRFDAIAMVLANPFNAGGVFSDQRMDNQHLMGLVPDERMRGMFHTPGIRGVSRTAPWGHGGTFTRMDDVIKHYASDVIRAMVQPRVGEVDLHLGNFHTDDQTVPELTAFMNAL
jgi:cytochrome c peroxidase